MHGDFVHTSESVTAAHPDKLCDRIADAVVDAHLAADPLARVSAECVMANGIVFLATRLAGDVVVDVAELVRRETAAVGYAAPELDPASLSIMTSFSNRAPGPRLESLEVDPAVVAAGQLVTAFGFATDETAELMPLPIALAHRVARELAAAARERRVQGLGIDAVAQVAVRYRAFRPVEIDAVTVEVAGIRGIDAEMPAFQRAVVADVVAPALADAAVPFAAGAPLLVNPAGAPEPGGPDRHTGLTGRKLAVDTYGGFARHAGAALSGKDPWRIDRTATYAARLAAKLVVAAGLASRCECQLAYRTDRAAPTSVQVDTFGSSPLADDVLARRLGELIDFRPAALARALRLAGPDRRPVAPLAAYGQVGGGAEDRPWEDVTAARALRESL
jgi:S-adenosylmethionine synthetase